MQDATSEPNPFAVGISVIALVCAAIAGVAYEVSGESPSVAVVSQFGTHADSETTGTGPESESTYAVTKVQLEALSTLTRDRAEVLYPWDLTSTSPFVEGADLPLQDAGGSIPVVGIDADCNRTSARTLAAMTSFPGLAFLNVSYCWQLTDEGIAHLTKLKSLRVLVMYRNSARFVGNNLPSHIGYEEATKIRQKLTDKAIDHICQIEGLQTLYLGQNKFSERAILRLGTLKTLRYLAIDSRQISAVGLERLQAELPECKIVVWGLVR